ncbi:hypothetical protein CF319_g841 [Tilletia indica]|nr:hypothetical protein CF319_g841 [Tilletia indica]
MPPRAASNRRNAAAAAAASITAAHNNSAKTAAAASPNTNNGRPGSSSRSGSAAIPNLKDTVKATLPDGLNMHPTFAFSMAGSIPFSLPSILAPPRQLPLHSSRAPSSLPAPSFAKRPAHITTTSSSSISTIPRNLPFRRTRKQPFPFLMPSQAALKALNAAAVKIIPTLPAESLQLTPSTEPATAAAAQPPPAKRPRKTTAVRSPISAGSSTSSSPASPNAIKAISVPSSSSTAPAIITSITTQTNVVPPASSASSPVSSTSGSGAGSPIIKITIVPAAREIRTSDSPWGRAGPPSDSIALRRNCFALANDRYPGAPGTALDKARKELQRAEQAAKRDATKKLNARAELEHLGVKGLGKKRKSASPYATPNQFSSSAAATAAAAAAAASSALTRSKGKGRASSSGSVPAESNPHPGSRSRRPASRAASPALNSAAVNGGASGSGSSGSSSSRITRSSSEDRISLPSGSNGIAGGSGGTANGQGASGAGGVSGSVPISAAQVFLGSAAAGHAPLRSSPLASHVITTAIDHDDDDDATEASLPAAALKNINGSSSSNNGRRAATGTTSPGTQSRSRSREPSPLRSVVSGGPTSNSLKRKASALSKEVLPDGSDSDSTSAATATSRDAIAA